MPVTSILPHVMDQRGGVALIMLLGFIGLAIPITIASIQISGQLFTQLPRLRHPPDRDVQLRQRG